MSNKEEDFNERNDNPGKGRRYDGREDSQNKRFRSFGREDSRDDRERGEGRERNFRNDRYEDRRPARPSGNERFSERRSDRKGDFRRDSERGYGNRDYKENRDINRKKIDNRFRSDDGDRQGGGFRSDRGFENKDRNSDRRKDNRFDSENRHDSSRSYGSRRNFDKRDSDFRSDRNSDRRGFRPNENRDDRRENRGFREDRRESFGRFSDRNDRDRRGFRGDDRRDDRYRSDLSDDRGERRDFEKRPYREDSGDFKGRFAERRKQNQARIDKYQRRDFENRGGRGHNKFEYGANMSYQKRPDYSEENLRGQIPPKKRVESQPERDTIRLNKYIANSGLCSRREADEMIASGQITVNGNVVTEMGFQVKLSDTVKYGRKVLNPEKMVYLLLNKPKDFITTTDDPEGRRTVMELIGNACPERIYPVGRLDRSTTGLLLFTNDGELAEKLSHPSNEMRKIYQVEIDKPISPEDFTLLSNGVELEDGFVKPDEVAIITPDRQVVGLEIHSGKNRVVRRIFEHLGYEVTQLDRTTYAGLTKKDLPRGNWRFLTEKEVIRLKYLI